MIARLLKKMRSLAVLAMMPSPPSTGRRSFAALDPPYDGRKFAWVRLRGGTLMPVILIDGVLSSGTEPVTTVLLRPSQYHLTVNELAYLYPAPNPKRDGGEVAWSEEL